MISLRRAGAALLLLSLAACASEAERRCNSREPAALYFWNSGMQECQKLVVDTEDGHSPPDSD